MKKIAFHGVPRSGTSWVGSIFDSSPNVAYRHQPLFSYSFKSYLSESSKSEEIEMFFRLLKETNDKFILQTEGKKNGHIPSFEKHKITHIVYKEARYHNILINLLKENSELIVVGIIRNPKSVISSWYLAPKEFNRIDWSLDREWKEAKLKNCERGEEFYGYDKWKEVASNFLQFQVLYPKRFFLITYSDLLINTEMVVKKLFEFCQIDYSKQTKQFLLESKSKDLSVDAYSVFRKNQADNKWKKILPKNIIEEINIDLRGTILEQFNR